MKNKRENRTHTREKILEESSKLFAEKGYSATGIDEIARNVGITKSVIYYHFKNKEDILHTLFQILFDELIRVGESEEHRLFHKTGLNFKDAVAVVMEILKIFATERNQRILKIMLVESVKNTGEIPLFKVWDLGTTQHQDLKPELIQRMWSEDQLMTKSFFMFIFPVVGFLVFKERWCEYYKIDADQAEKAMVEGLEEYFMKVIRPQL